MNRKSIKSKINQNKTNWPIKLVDGDLNENSKFSINLKKELNHFNDSKEIYSKSDYNLQSTKLVDDSILTLILNEINLNDRLKLKSVSKQYARVIDQLLLNLKQLILFDRMPIINNKFNYSDENYDLNDALYVKDLNYFLKKHADKLKNIEKLIIIGLGKDVYELDYLFDNLQHLELYNCCISNSKILESPKLENLFNENVIYLYPNLIKFNKINKKLTNLTISSSYLANVCKSIDELIYLEIPETFEYLFLDKMIKLKVQLLKIRSNDIKIIELLNRFECLERIDLIIINLSPLFHGSLMHKLNQFIRNKRENLDLFIFGYKITIKTINRFELFLELINGSFMYLCLHVSSDDVLKFKSNKIGLTIEQDSDSLEQLEHIDKEVKGFWYLIDFLEFVNLSIYDLSFKKLTNVKKISITLDDPNYLRRFNEEETSSFFSFFPNLLKLEINCDKKIELSNQFLDKLPLYCKKLNYLKLQCWNKSWSTGFLSQLTQLKYLIVISYQSIKNRNFLRLLKQMKDNLAYFRFSFKKPQNGYLKDDLKKFKSKINSQIVELNYKKNATIEIQIIHRNVFPTNISIINYTYQHTSLMEKQFEYVNEKSDYESLLDVIKQRRLIE